MEVVKNKYEEALYSKAVRAGRRTYFFDVRKTREGNPFIAVTESKKVFKEDGSSYFEKHKVFIYQEDFERFQDGLQDTLHFIKNGPSDSHVAEEKADHYTHVEPTAASDVNFEDLGQS